MGFGVQFLYQILRWRARLYVATIALLFAVSIPCSAVFSGAACQNYLIKAPVEVQCGPLCVVFAFKNMLEGLSRGPLSTEYALLAVAEADVSARAKAILDRSLDPILMQNPTGTWEWPGFFALDPVIGTATNGVFQPDQFPDVKAALRFHAMFGMDLTRENVMKIYESAVTRSAEAVQLSKEGRVDEAKLKIDEFLHEAKRLVDYVADYRSLALATWQRLFGRYTFDVVLSNRPQTAAFFSRMLNRYLPGSELVSITDLSEEKFRERAIRELQRRHPLMMCRTHKTGSGHALVAYACTKADGIFARDSALNSDDPLRGRHVLLDLESLGSRLTHFIVAKRKPVYAR